MSFSKAAKIKKLVLLIKRLHLVVGFAGSDFY